MVFPLQEATGLGDSLLGKDCLALPHDPQTPLPHSTAHTVTGGAKLD